MMGNSFGQVKLYRHNLTDIQFRHMQDRVKAKKEKGGAAYLCKHCQNNSAYVYNSFSKRGGTKTLIACEKCHYYWSEFSCEEEDYDFLPG